VRLARIHYTVYWNKEKLARKNEVSVNGRFVGYEEFGV